MNSMGIDYGTKRVGLAIAINGIIHPLCVLKNDISLFKNILAIISEYQITQVFVGVSEGKFARDTKNFVKKLSPVIKLPIKTVEESVSTIEADVIYKTNKGKKKDYKQKIDQIAAAIILKRALSD